MRSFRTCLRVEGFEERLVPATFGDYLKAAAEVTAGASFFKAATADPGWLFNTNANTLVRNQLLTIFRSSRADLALFNSTPSGIAVGNVVMLKNLATNNMLMAEKVGAWIGFNVNPVKATTAPTTPTPTDAGMVNTMPDPNSASFVPVGAAGLKSWDVVVGNGTPVATGDSITIFYTGWLASNGTKFDSRRSPSTPITFSLSGLIQGWQQGIPGMKPGGIRRLFIPAALGYGAAGSPPNIPANADLVFEIKLISHHA